MPRYATAADHLSEDELKERYRNAKDSIESRRYHLVLLVKQKWSLKKAAQAVGLNYDYAQDILKGYNQDGPEALRNRLKDNRPKPSLALLSLQQQQALRERLQAPPDDGGIWTGPKVAEWIAKETGKAKVWPQRGWDYLKRLGLSWQRPRPRHRLADPEEQAAFKGQLQTRLHELQAEHANTTVEVWAFDEHRLGLKPILRKVWSPVGTRPIAEVHHRYEWLYVYAYVHPQSGSTEWHLLPRVQQAWFECSLADFAKVTGAGIDKLIVLQVDRARWHTTDTLQIPTGIEILTQPSYSPEVQPAERLWSLVDEPIVNRAIESLDKLEEIIAQRCCVLSEQFQEKIQRLTCFHWWPQQANSLAGLV